MSIGVTAGRLKLPFAPRLHADERLDAWSDITSGLYGVTRGPMLWHLCGEPVAAEAQGGLEASPAGQRLLAQLRAVDPLAGSQSWLPAAVDLLPAARAAYCPLCFLQDMKVEGLPYFRSGWDHCFRTHCTVHLCPLFPWPWRQPDGSRRVPGKLLEQFWVPHGREVEATPAGKRGPFTAQLRLARQMRRWLLEGHPNAMAWRLHQRFEEGLLHGGERFAMDMVGGSVRQLHIVIADLTTLLTCNFPADWREPLITYLASFFGPVWLFAKLDSRQVDLPAGRAGLRSIASPAARRSVLSAVHRTLLSFVSDLTCDGRDCSILETGETAVSRELRQLSNAAKKWAGDRMKYWPLLVRKGLEKSLR